MTVPNVVLPLAGVRDAVVKRISADSVPIVAAPLTLVAITVSQLEYAVT
eukprot:CAMPEP_0174873502 /NCGR_PEP_ID=MMETSP1114-20130205/75027_1 /TAXON_ID=312471 /ORGANISM="Neobodo designis, Strain CCAP 1951/1" /LENGTH=48 /DNA_ID= /DNA_START= /DNA_END= /DNA_ORIENTATION=